MNKIFEILPNKSGTVRTTLCIEDVKFLDIKVLKGFELIKVDDSMGESVIIFKEPYRVPKFNIFYASKIKSVSDPYLKEAVARLLYLNPNPDFYLIKKLTEFILMRFSAIEMVESPIKIGMESPKPVLTFDEVENFIRIYSSVGSEYEPDNEDSIMFYRESGIAKADKIRLRAFYRANMVKDLLEKAIHTVAEHLIEAQNQIKITDTRIESTKMVSTKRGPASVKTIRKYMSDRTRRIMQEHNNIAPFSTQASLEKFQQFLDMPEESSLTAISEELQVSRSTAASFKQLRESNAL